jgi:hypothetical protein
MKNMKSSNPGYLVLRSVIFVILFLLPDCNKFESDQMKIKVGTPFTAEVGIRYQIDNNLSFTIDSIKDQRCPRLVECFWSGFVALSFNITQNRTSIDTLIYFMMPLNNPFHIDNYKWEVLEVVPWLEYGQLIDQEDYRVKMIIEHDE